MVIKDDLPERRSVSAGREEGRALDRPPSEKMFNAPAVAVLVAVSMPLLYIVQGWLPFGGAGFAFRPASLVEGGWWPGLVTAMFVHLGWSHVAMNVAGAVAFGPPVARLMPGLSGAVGYLLFYIASGIVAALGYGLIHLDSHGLAAGASGAVFGLTGAAIRLLGVRGGRVRPLGDRRVLGLAVILMGVNAATGLIGFVPGLEGAIVAWEAHAFGFVFGFLMIGPWSRIFRTRSAFASRTDPGDPAV